MLGVAAGFALLMFANKPHAQALTNSLITSQQVLLEGGDAQNSEVAKFALFPPLQDKMTILVMGVDSNGQKAERWVATRSDTMMLIGLNPESRQVGVVSIPRDSRVSIYGHGTDKINAAHAIGGPRLAVETVQEVLGVPVDHFVVIDTQGLKKLFEILGPVEVLVENKMKYQDHSGHLNVDLMPGRQVLDPAQAEEYVRFRHDARGDIGRIERQQWFLRQVVNKLKEPEVVLKLPQLFDLAARYVVTDLSTQDMARLACFLKDIVPSEIQSATLPGCSQTIAGGSYWIPDIDASRIVLARLIDPALNSFSDPTPVVQSMAAETEQTRASDQFPKDTANLVTDSKPLTVAIKYPPGAKELAGHLSSLLELSGIKVRYKWLAPLAECQHEQIVQISARADEIKTNSLKQSIPVLLHWPVVVALETRPYVDFTLVVSQDSSLLTASETTGPIGRHIEPLLMN